MKKRTNKIAYRLTIYIITGVSILFLMIVFINYRVSRNIWLEKAKLTADIMEEKAIKKTENPLKRAEDLTRERAYELETGMPATVDEINNFLKNFVINHKRITGSALALNYCPVDINADYFLSYYSEEADSVFRLYNKEFMKNELYKEPLKTGSEYWSEPHFDAITGENKVITFSVPIKIKGEFRGVITADIPLDWLDNVVSSYKIYDSGFAFLISHKCTALTHPVKDFIMNRNLREMAEGYESNIMDGVLIDIADRKDGLVELTDPYLTEGKIFLLYHPIEVLEGTLIIVIPRNEVLGGLYNLTFTLLLIAFVSFALLIITIYFIIKKQLLPLKELNNSLLSLGEGNFDVDIPEPKKIDEVGQLSKSFLIMKEYLKEHIILLDESITEKEKIESEVRVAANIQKSILPKELPPELSNLGIDVYGLLKPAKQIGGDLFDYFIDEKKKLYFILGDVTGKGIPSSFFMGMTRAYFRSESKYITLSGDLVEKINKNLCLNNPETVFVTLFCGIMDTSSGIIDFCNAGHNLPYVVRNDGEIMELVNQHGPPAGVMENQKYKSDKLELKTGESLILFTDGVTETRNEKDEMFGNEKLRKILVTENIQTITSKNICETVITELEAFKGSAEQTDDITIFAMKR